MTQIAAAVNQKFVWLQAAKRGVPWRILALAAVAALALSSAEAFRIVLAALSDAFLTVSVFVAGTLALIYGLERAFRTDLGHLLMQFQRWQVPAGALMGAFPGCGGAIVMVTQYTKGHASFGTLVATLTATMGDAMFLLLAKEPGTGLAIWALAIVVGTVSGWAVDAVHGQGFLRPRRPQVRARLDDCDAEEASAGPLAGLWFALVLPGLFLGLLDAFQVELASIVPLAEGFDPALWLGVAGAVLALILWAKAGQESEADAISGQSTSGVAGRIMADTNFITAWVVFAFLAYELGVHFSGADLGAAFELWAPLVPLIAVVVGFLPGCGPQIVVTTLYLTGSLPLSAQLGNAIGNDGDALFPAIALAPRAALLATIYSALPALLIAYSYFFLFE